MRKVRARTPKEKAKASTTRTIRAKPKARGRPTRLDKAVVSELRIVTLVDFVDDVDIGNEIAEQSNNKDKYEEKEIGKEATS